MEWINIKPGFWGETGGHVLRIEFLKEAKRRGYSYITSYVHRNVIMQRVNKGENIEIVQKYDPDKLDYYRVNVSTMISSPLAEAVAHNKSKTEKSIDMANMEMDKKLSNYRLI
jgi:hypothetical protein